jgi:hypothetical protein
MADELDLTVVLPGTPETALAAWADEPPAFLEEGGLHLVDESYESLVYEGDVMGRGMKLLMWGMAKTVYRVTVTFRPDPVRGTRVTLTGQLPERARARADAWAHGQG